MWISNLDFIKNLPYNLYIMIYLLLGIVIGITISIVNIFLLTNEKTSKVLVKKINQVKRSGYKIAKIVDMSEPIDLDAPLE